MARPTLEFVKAALRNPLEVSTIFPTSHALAETLLNHADIARADRVVELGCGTGAITEHLEPKLARPDSYFGVELDAQMVEYLRENYPDLKFEIGFAENISEWLAEASVDVVVSSLPWTVFDFATQRRTIDAIVRVLKPGGSFLTYICANALLMPRARSFLKLLHSEFEFVHRSPLEWRNIPPAFVYKSVSSRL